MSGLLALSLAGLAAASPSWKVIRQAAPDNANLVIGNISQTITDIISLNNTLNSYGYNETDIGFGAIATYGGANNLATDLNNTLNAATASAPFTLDESQNIYLNLSALISPAFDLLDNFVAHCGTYANIGVKSIVYSDLQVQRTGVVSEANAISAKIAQPYPASIAFGANLIASRFDSAIAIFAQASCPPPGSTAFPSGSGGAGGTVTSTTTVTLSPSASTCPTAGVSTITTTAPASTVVSTTTAPASTVVSTITLSAAASTCPTAGVSTVTTTAPASTVVSTVVSTAPASTVVSTIVSTTTLSAAPSTCPSTPASTVTSTIVSTTTLSAAPSTCPSAGVSTVVSTVVSTAPASTVTTTLPASTTTIVGSGVTATVVSTSTVVSTKTVSGVGSTTTVTSPGSTITKATTITSTASGSCSSTTSDGPCYFWQPCWASYWSKTHPATTTIAAYGRY